MLTSLGGTYSVISGGGGQEPALRLPALCDDLQAVQDQEPGGRRLYPGVWPAGEKPVLWIRDHCMDPDSRIHTSDLTDSDPATNPDPGPAILVSELQDDKKKLFFLLFITLWSYIYIFFKDKKSKNSAGIKILFYFFCANTAALVKRMWEPFRSPLMRTTNWLW